MDKVVVYGIVDRWTKNVWSRNRWATPTSLPDLYQTRVNAERQIKKGKIAIMRRYNETLQPEVVEYTLEAVK